MDRKQLAEKMYRTYRAFMHKLVSRIFMESNLSEFQTRELFALEILGENPWISMSELSEALSTAKNTTTGIINRMVRRKLVARRHSKEDRRVVKIALTEKGKAIWDEYLSLHLGFSEGLLAALTDAEAKQYLKLNEKIVATLDAN